MRKILYLTLCFTLYLACGPNQDDIERVIEDGVEVIMNHIEPYKIKEEPSTLHLDYEFTLDTEDEELLDIGLIGIESFDVDSEGNIYLIQWQSQENYVFKFDASGSFLKSFKEIFVGHSERGYEIHVYNSSGNILRKIRKNYKPIKVPEEYKKTFFDRYPGNHPYGTNCYFTNHWPPFRYLFPDDEGRLYVMTYEEGEKPGEFLYDIFNREGIFIGRIKLDNLDNNRPTPVKAKKNRLYLLHVKESGYKELMIYIMRWEKSRTGTR